jgi:hypothetical protein
LVINEYPGISKGKFFPIMFLVSVSGFEMGGSFDSVGFSSVGFKVACPAADSGGRSLIEPEYGGVFTFCDMVPFGPGFKAGDGLGMGALGLG